MRSFTNSVAFDIKFATLCDFLKKKHNFFSKNAFILYVKTIFERFENSYYFNCILQQIFISGDFYKIKFFSKIPYIFFTITKVWRFREVLFFQSRFTTSLLCSAIFWKKSICFRKTHQFFFPPKNLNFERFENFHYFSRFLQQLCYIYCFFFLTKHFFWRTFLLQQKT